VEDDLDQVGMSGNAPNPLLAPTVPVPTALLSPPPPAPSSPSPTTPPVASQPICHSTRICYPPQQYWLTQYREPTPIIPESSDEDVPVEYHQELVRSDDDEDEVEETLLTVPDAFEFAYKVTAPIDSPKSLAAALKIPEADKWYNAAYQEIKALVDNGTWSLAKLPPGRRPIGCRWVSVVKKKKDRSIDCFKACLVAKGYAQ